MTPFRFDPGSLFFRTFAAAGIISLIVLTLADRGATRAYSTPWNGLLLLAQVAPLIALVLRSTSRTRAFFFPPKVWLVITTGFDASVLFSSLLSPYRGESLLGALTPLGATAAFFIMFDWWNHDRVSAAVQIHRWAGYVALAIVLVSLGHWVASDVLPTHAYRHFSTLLVLRNPYPLGHSNYTAGLALLGLPWLGLRVLHSRGWSGRFGWAFACGLAVLMLFSSGSRGGMVGLAVLLAAAIWWARLPRRQLALVIVACAMLASALAYANPRTRSLLFRPHSAGSLTAASDVQRTAMATAGFRMGLDRPVLGWGTGVTPQVYPRYRAGLDGGTENVLQLHSTPIQIWADLGGLGLACSIGFLGLVASRIVSLRNARPGTVSVEPDLVARVQAAAALGFTTYLAYSLTDFQFDVPIFAAAIAAASALLAPTTPGTGWPQARATVTAVTLGSLGLIAAFGRPSAAPALNVQALTLARAPAETARAIALLKESLALDASQEIAHFNLGWLLVVSDPVEAEQHFISAARLVPDKGGVYFGLALARLNQGQREDAAAHALAIECLNDPLFLTSPWWREPSIAALHDRTHAALRRMCEQVAAVLDARGDIGRARDARYISGLAEWLSGRGLPGEMLRLSHTTERVSYFAARPPVPDFRTSPIRVYRRERTGYPVLMRNLDLAPAVDVFDVRETIPAADQLRFLFPTKGWLASPLLLQLLEQ